MDGTFENNSVTKSVETLAKPTITFGEIVPSNTSVDVNFTLSNPDSIGDLKYYSSIDGAST